MYVLCRLFEVCLAFGKIIVLNFVLFQIIEDKVEATSPLIKQWYSSKKNKRKERKNHHKSAAIRTRNEWNILLLYGVLIRICNYFVYTVIR